MIASGKIRLLFAASALVAIAVFPGATSADRGDDPTSIASIKAPAPRVTEPGAEGFVAKRAIDIPALDCVITPHELINVGSPVEGIIESFSVERGGKLVRGQVLARLDTKLERTAVALAKAQAEMTSELESREVNHAFGMRQQERVGELFRRKALAVQQQDETETDARLAALQVKQAKENQRVAELQLERARVALEQRVIRSPIDGVVLERMMAPGERVSDQPIIRIAQIDPLRVEVIAQAELFGSIHPGMRAEVTPEAPAQGSYEATVAIVDPVIDAASGTFGVRLDVPNPNHGIPAGVRCRVRLKGE